MKRQPRNPLRDKLVNERLISIAYGQIGRSIVFYLFIIHICICTHTHVYICNVYTVYMSHNILNQINHRLSVDRF